MVVLISPDCFLSLIMLAMIWDKAQGLVSVAPGKNGTSESFLEEVNRNWSLSCNPSGSQSTLKNTEQTPMG